MQDGTESKIRKDLNFEIETLEKRYAKIKKYLAETQIEDFEVVGAIKAYKDALSAISAHIVTLYQLDGQRTKITWESLFKNIDTALDTIQNSAHPNCRAAIQTALDMSEPKVEDVMAYLATLKQSL